LLFGVVQMQSGLEVLSPATSEPCATSHLRPNPRLRNRRLFMLRECMR
jgi:hypothetical protein